LAIVAGIKNTTNDHAKLKQLNA